MKRSALYSLHRRAGASFAEYSGWELPAFFTSPERDAALVRESAGLADASHSPKFDLQSETVLESGPRRKSWRLGRNHYLVVGKQGDPPPGGIDVTSVYAALRLVGPKSREVLSKLTSLNSSDAGLPNLGCAQASLAHVPAIFLRQEIGEMPGFYLLITRDYAESVWEAILQAGHEFHLAPIGMEALLSLQG